MKTDAERYQWLKKKVEFELGSYVSESGWLPEATHSDWFIRTPSLFAGTNKPPVDLDSAIDASMDIEAAEGSEK